MKAEEISVTILGAAYLLGIIIAAAITQNHPALALAITAAGLSYIAQVTIALSPSIPSLDRASWILWGVAVLVAWASGMAIVFRGG